MVLLMLIKEWHKYLQEYKRKEAGAVFRGFSRGRHGRCLEIGSGNGFEATLIKDYFSSFIATEYNGNGFGIRDKSLLYCTCNAERLPFKDESFDFVFSSNVIEHIKDRQASLSEMRRVLKDGGTAIHIVPSRMWKFLNCALLYPYLFLLLLNIKELKRRIMEKKEDSVDCGRGMAVSFRRGILKYAFPRVHGEYRGHTEEFTSYGRRQWEDFFRKSGFAVTKTIKLPLTSGYGFSLDRLKPFLERMGFSSTYAIFMVQRDKKR